MTSQCHPFVRIPHLKVIDVIIGTCQMKVTMHKPSNVIHGHRLRCHRPIWLEVTEGDLMYKPFNVIQESLRRYCKSHSKLEVVKRD